MPSERLVAVHHRKYPTCPTGDGDANHPNITRRQKIYRRLAEANLLALCLSGGGLRSASFGLGILQGLASEGWLGRFHYLSTVSGGGYIGAWLSAWCARKNRDNARPNGMKAVETWLSGKKLFPGTTEPKEVSRLRDFTSYLTPRTGLTSSDTWTGVAILCRNLVLNWLLFLPLFIVLVWLPKFLTIVLGFMELNVLDRRGSIELDLPGHVDGGTGKTLDFVVSVAPIPLLIIVGMAFYVWALYFMARQQIGAGGNGGLRAFILNALLPLWLAAVVASVLLEHFRSSAGLWLPNVWAVGLVGGAVLWLFTFVLGGARDPSYIVARAAGGLAFGASLVEAARAIGHFDLAKDPRLVVVLGLPVFFICHLAGYVIFIGASSRVRDHDEDREWGARASAWLLVVGVGWLVYSFLVLWEPTADGPQMPDWAQIVHFDKLDPILAPIGGLAGIASALFAKKTSAKPQGHRVRSRLSWTRLAFVGAVLFFAILIYKLSGWFDQILFSTRFTQTLTTAFVDNKELNLITGALLVLLAWLLGASALINVNKFSLHAYYRNRLIRAYLGASHDKRQENPFTGFDEGDNRRMCELLLPKDGPIHVVNMTLNLIRGKKLAWQERKASSFTVTQLAAGSAILGYRPANEYGNAISLGTAMTISGAAVSPSMGYHSSPSLSFLMTLFNMRLGWWLGNPRDRRAWRKPGPTWSIFPILFELFGLTNENAPYVYLSDGGHFDNLGIYEMLRRRCTTILAVDATCDPLYLCEDLARAVRRAQIDFGVRVEFDGQEVFPALPTKPEAPAVAVPYYTVARITYPENHTGRLILIKAAMHGGEPPDVLGYKAAHPDFPHEATVDQFFTESQFESYRQLGRVIMEKVCRKLSV